MSSLKLASCPNCLQINKESAPSPQSSLSHNMFLLLLCPPWTDNRQENLPAKHTGYSKWRIRLWLSQLCIQGEVAHNSMTQQELQTYNNQKTIQTTPFIQLFSAKLVNWLSVAQRSMGTRKGSGTEHHFPLKNSSQLLDWFNNNVQFHLQELTGEKYSYIYVHP